MSRTIWRRARGAANPLAVAIAVFVSVAVPAVAGAQVVAIASEQKISDTAGGLSHSLANFDYFGAALAPLGDLDGDTTPDVVVGIDSSDAGGADEGALIVLFLNADGTVKAEQLIAEGTGGFAGVTDGASRFGSSVAALGDLDGDTVVDLLVGAPQRDDGGTARGAVWVLFMNTDGTVKGSQRIASTDGGFGGALGDQDWFGASASWLGDLDGDTVADAVVGAPLDDDGGTNQGAAWVLFLNADGTVKGQQKISSSAGGFGGTLVDDGEFGQALAAVGDVDGDTIVDLVIGNYKDDDGGNDTGAAWVVFLNADGTVKGEQKISASAGGFAGTLNLGDQFGSAVANVGDLDGDTVPDVAVGATGDDDGGANLGAVWILFLNADGTVKSHEKISASSGGILGVLDLGDEFGNAVARLGDVDANGVDDWAFGTALDDDGGFNRGAVYVSFATGCGDSSVGVGEQCDDGNQLDGDCCSSTCQFEAAASACDDGNDCTDEQCDGAGTCAFVANNAAACDDGVYCNGTDTCAAGACTVHAGDPCPGADGDGDCRESCDELADSCTSKDADLSVCDDGVFCNGADSCDGVSGLCANHGGDPCPGADGDGDCAESCDEAGDTCTAADVDGSACDDGAFCNGADTCSGGSCSVNAGDPCTGADGDGDCAESCDEAGDTCTAADVDGAACDDGAFCNGADTCSGGNCSASAGDPCAGPDGDGDCAESCDEADDTCTAADPNGSACDDGAFCNGTDTCSAGTCSVSAGDPCTGADGDGDCAESCDEAGDTCTAADVDGSACDDGAFCNGTDTCSGGACSVSTGDPCTGPDGDGDCAESCDEAGDTCTAADVDGSACDDGAFCNGADTCSGGSCAVNAGDPCPGADGDGDCAESCDEAGDACTAADPNGSACEDGAFCNGADTCSGGNCSVSAGDPCPGADGDGDCAESCDEAGDTCTAADPNGSVCDDGTFCNGADTCSAGACSVSAGGPCPGADGDGDCAESCDEAGDTCSAADVDGSACDDGAFCNGADTCSGGSCSVSAGDPCAGPDGDGDCAESCDEAGDTCTAADPNGSACDDGAFCNGADTCSGGNCSVNAGDPCTGPDGDGDCAESCDETGDACTAADPNGAACDDGAFCNGADTCSSGACSVNAGDPCPGADGDGDCAESCDEATDDCSAADPNGSACDDGAFCNGADTCSGGNCSVNAGDPCPGADGDGNCAESCDETTDNCTGFDPAGAVCDDGMFCNGADTCDGFNAACSTHVGDPCPGADGDADCAESCDETADDCSAADPNGAACDDGTFCNGADTCSAGTCSVNNGDPCLGGGQCADTCDEALDTCNLPDGTVCDDGLFCTELDACIAGACEGGPNPCGESGTCTETCNETEQVCKGCGQPFSNTSCMTNALVTLQTAIGLAQCEACICDVDGSGAVGATDALVVLHWCVGTRGQPDQCPELDSLLTWGTSSTTTSLPAPSSSTTSTTIVAF